MAHRTFRPSRAICHLRLTQTLKETVSLTTPVGLARSPPKPRDNPIPGNPAPPGEMQRPPSYDRMAKARPQSQRGSPALLASRTPRGLSPGTLHHSLPPGLTLPPRRTTSAQSFISTNVGKAGLTATLPPTMAILSTSHSYEGGFQTAHRRRESHLPS